MKKLSVMAGMVLALGLAVMPVKAQDETPGQQIVFTGTALPANGYSCGRASYPLYCYGIPADSGGSFWLDVYYNAYPKPTGFIQFFNVADIGQASIVTAVVSRNALNQVNKLDVTFTGLTNDGDNGSYSGVATFNFTYVKMTGGSGRGGGYPGNLMYVSSYSMTITYN